MKRISISFAGLFMLSALVLVWTGKPFSALVAIVGAAVAALVREPLRNRRRGIF